MTEHYLGGAASSSGHQDTLIVSLDAGGDVSGETCSGVSSTVLVQGPLDLEAIAERSFRMWSRRSSRS